MEVGEEGDENFATVNRKRNIYIYIYIYIYMKRREKQSNTKVMNLS